jgi:multimeric flavodoxin WrbA
MNVLILNGALAGDRELDAVQDMIALELAAHSHTVRSLRLREMPIAYCQGCFECWLKTPGVCRTHDHGPDVARDMINCDAAFFLTPVTFGGYSSELKKALDRSIGLVLPFFTRVAGEVHHQKRYDAYPALVVIGLLSQPCAEEEAVFHALAQRNALNMHVPWYTSRVFIRTMPASALRASIHATVVELEGAA